MMGNNIIRAEGQATCNGVDDYSSTCKYCIRFCIYKITDLGLYGAACNGISILPVSLFFGTLYIKLS
jgi:hypothetical protein